MQLSGIFIYPVKSLRGIALDVANVEPRGLQYDRRWMIVDNRGHFFTQRAFPEMVLLTTEITPEYLVIRHVTKNLAPLQIALQPAENATAQRVQIWDDMCKALTVSEVANEWLSEALDTRCQLVYMPDDCLRPTDPDFSKPDDIVSFADGFPILIIGQASLDDLNTRLQNPVPMNRFRPNLVFTGGAPYEEDAWKHFTIGDLHFRAVKPCARCVLTTVNQETAERGAEPLKTLSKYRLKNKNILFGMNVCRDMDAAKDVFVKRGDAIRVL
jgi:hypothetical protein